MSEADQIEYDGARDSADSWAQGIAFKRLEAMGVKRKVIGAAELWLGRCESVLPVIGYAGVCVTDPPYGIGYAHSGFHDGTIGITKAANLRGAPPVLGDDKPFDPSPLLQFSNVLMWGANHYHARLPDKGRWLAWNKLADREPWDSFADVEFAWHSGKGAARIFSMMWKGLACDKRGENGGLREHTTQKPIRLMRWCIDQTKASPGSLIVDPYCGSGTTGVAALQMGYRFVGIEAHEPYFEIACRRIEEAQRQQDLFIKPASTP